MRKFIVPVFFVSVVITICSCKKNIAPLVSLVDTKELTSSSACPNGGIIISAGVDKNRNNVLDQDEITNTKSVCNGQNGTNGGYDRVVILTLFSVPNISYATSGPSGFIHPGVLVKFSKRNYVGVDSIKLVANPWVEAGASGMIELFNVTDNVPIANSTITTNNTTYSVFSESSNVFTALPDKEISIGVRMWTNDRSSTMSVSSAFLVLYRK